MLAILPNRQSVPDGVQARNWINVLTRGMRVAAALVVMFGPSQRGWTQSGSTNAQSRRDESRKSNRRSAD